MKKISRIKLLFFVVVLATFATCKEPYDAKLTPTQTNFLVVEGFINANGPTTINLSRTVTLNEAGTIKPEINAEIKIAGEDNSTFNVSEIGGGKYTSADLVLNPNQKYRLLIRTQSGTEYASSLTAIKQTPAIDKVHWKPGDNGIDLFVNTHDDTNNSRYYKWEYDETWEFHSAYTYAYEYRNGDVFARPPDEIPKLYFCWTTQHSTSLLLGSSAQLVNDVINDAPINHIPIDGVQLSVRYSILVKQIAIERAAFDFFKMMKTNTESLGSVFDPLPSNLTGNITCVTNPTEKVIGFIPAATIAEKRIFITAPEVGSQYRTTCQSFIVPNSPDSIKFYYTQGYRPYAADGTFPMIEGYYSSIPICLDCTLRGTNVKPSFW